LNRLVVRELPDLDATRRLAEQVADGLTVPIVIALSGPLGAGKTQWCRHLCTAAGVPPESVTSPTYVLVQQYHGSRWPIFHLDFYRLSEIEQVWDLGFDELREQSVIVLVEWADKFPEALPEDRLEIILAQSSVSESRRAELRATGPKSLEILQRSGLTLAPSDQDN
jgi:tRNA threonylcarbamoyladenosine biosynthesis protein TsaE